MSYARTWFAALGFTFVSFLPAPARAVEAESREIVRFRQVNENLYRGGYPRPDDLAMLRDLGVRTVVSLMNEKERVVAERKAAQALGLKFLNFPINVASYPSRAKLRAILTEVYRAENFPVYVHCAAGKDRTGLVMGLYRVYQDGWDPYDAWDEMVDIGFNRWLFGLGYAFWWNVKRPLF